MDRKWTARGSVMRAALMAGVAAVTWPVSLAQAADLGGNCCADLEERIADLEATTSRKGNRKVSLTVSGWVNEVVYFTDYTATFSQGSFIVEIPGVTFVTSVTPGTPVVASGSQMAVLDTSSFTHEDRARRNVLSGVEQTVGGVLGGTIACAAPTDETVAAHTSQQCTRRGVWAAALGGYADIDETRSAFAAEQTLVGGLAGAHFDAAPGITAGLFGGFAETDLSTEYNAEHIETTFAIAGAFARLRKDQGFADVSVTGLWSDSDRQRNIASNIGGTRHYEAATANGNGWMISPALTLGLRLPVAGDVTFVPAMKLRGTFGQLDGFTETGSPANVMINARDVAEFDSRLEIGLDKTFSAGAGLTALVRATAGVSYFGAFGDDTINGRMLGQAISFSSGAAKSEFGGYVGLGLDVPLSASASLFADTEMHMSDRAQSISGFGGVKVKF